MSKEHQHNITAITSYKDFTITASGSPSVLTVWRRGKLVHAFYGHTGKVNSLMMLGQHLLSVGSGPNRTLRLWDMKEFAPAGTLPPFEGSFSPTCMIHPNTYLNKILIGGESGELQLWNIQSKKLIYSFKGWDSKVTSLAQSPAVDVIAIALADGTVKLHNIRADETIFSVKMGNGNVAVTSVTFRTDGRPIMATGGSNGTVALWNLERKGELLGIIGSAHEAPVSSLAFLEGEPILISAAADNSVKMWIFDNGSDPGFARLLRSRAGHSKPSTKIAYYGDDGRYLISAGQDRSLRSFNVVRDQQMIEFSQGKGILKKAKKFHKATEQMKLSNIVDFSSCKYYLIFYEFFRIF